MIDGESLEQPLKIPHHELSQLALRGEFSSSRNGSKASMPICLCTLVYAELRFDVGLCPM